MVFNIIFCHIGCILMSLWHHFHQKRYWSMQSQLKRYLSKHLYINSSWNEKHVGKLTFRIDLSLMSLWCHVMTSFLWIGVKCLFFWHIGWILMSLWHHYHQKRNWSMQSQFNSYVSNIFFETLPWADKRVGNAHIR